MAASKSPTTDLSNSDDPPSYHVDLERISKLIYDVGAGGLKQLALSGVDIHSVASLMMIADLCPASENCKAKIHRCREKQRKEVLRLYETVEIGAATNFVADLLLKSQPGSNALALLSTILPLMSKAASSATMTFLFRKAGVSPDHTPGVGQLERLRDTVLPLVTNTPFKGKVLQYHVWMIRLLDSLHPNRSEGEAVSPLKNLYDSIPHEDVLPDIILLLRKVSGTKQKLVFELNGIEGAAWIAAYARDILGLSVCVFGDPQSPVPASGDLKTAKVILRPYSTTMSFLIRDGECVEETVQMRPLSYTERAGWVVDLEQTNYLDLHVPPSNAHLRQLFNSLASSMTKSCVEILAQSFYWREDEGCMEDSQKFLVPHIPLFTQKALSVMRVLGFECSADATSAPWKKYFCFHQRGKSTENWENKPSQLLRRWSTRTTRTSAHLAPTQSWEENLRKTMVEEDSPECEGPEFNSSSRRVVSCLLKAVGFASTMAFTNWGTDFCNMSVNYLQNEGGLDEAHPLICRDLMHSMFMGKISSGFVYGELLEYILEITTDARSAPHASSFTDDRDNLLAISLDGAVFVRTMAVESLADLVQPTFLSIHPGTIIAGSEPRLCIKSAPSKVLDPAELVREPTGTVIPTNSVPTLSLRHHLSLHRDTVHVTSDIRLGHDLLQSADPILISENIPNLWVPSPCSHGYDKPYTVVPASRVIHNRHLDDPSSPSATPLPPKVHTGLSFQSHLRPKHMRWHAPNGRKILYVQGVDGNKLGQWVACQWTPNLKGAMMVLQAGYTCLKCVDENTDSKEVCVINGKNRAPSMEVLGSLGDTEGAARDDVEGPPPPYTEDMEIGVARTIEERVDAGAS